MGFEFKNPFEKKGNTENHLEKLDREMIKDGDKHEKYQNEQLKGIEVVFLSIAGDITIMLRKDNPDRSVSQRSNNFSKNTMKEAKMLFDGLKNIVDTSAVAGDDKEVAFKKAESLFT